MKAKGMVRSGIRTANLNVIVRYHWNIKGQQDVHPEKLSTYSSQPPLFGEQQRPILQP